MILILRIQDFETGSTQSFNSMGPLVSEILIASQLPEQLEVLGQERPAAPGQDIAPH